MNSETDPTIKHFSDMLIQRGVAPGIKKYSYVRPKGINIFMPSMWRRAKALEQVRDDTYYTLMNEAKLALFIKRHEQLMQSLRQEE